MGGVYTKVVCSFLPKNGAKCYLKNGACPKATGHLRVNMAFPRLNGLVRNPLLNQED